MNTRAAAALLFVICVTPADLAAQAPPTAPDWAATFGAEAMKAHQRGAERHVVIPGDANAKEAADALAAGLRAAGAPLVMDSAALGDTTSPEDSSLLAKTAALPVELVWIVRVYPGAQPDQQSAVLLVYENTGAKLRYAVQATPAKPLDPPPAVANTAASGVSANARDAVTDKKPVKTPQNSADNKQTYLDNQLGITELEIVEHNTSGVSTKTTTTPWRGQNKRTLSWPEFYELTGRRDLAEEYRANENNHMALVVVGGVAAVAGPLLIFIAASSPDDGPKDSTYGMFVGGGILSIAGLSMLIAGALYDPSVADSAKNRKLVQDYNESLQKSLGVEVREDNTSSFNLQIAPMFHTPGVILQLNF